MTMTTTELYCCICEKNSNTYKCDGCSTRFCFKHLEEHRQTTHQQLDEIERDRDHFLETLMQQRKDPKRHALFQIVEKWEEESIEKIRRTADQCKQVLINVTNQHLTQMGKKLKDFTDQLKHIRRNEELNEKQVDELRERLTKLQTLLDTPPGISIEEQKTAFITKLSVVKPIRDKWKQDGVTIAGGNGKGDQLNQLSGPYGIYVDGDGSVYIADCRNHRIVLWKCDDENGQVVAEEQQEEVNENAQTCSPTDVIVNKLTDSIFIADRGNRRVMRWSRQNIHAPEIIVSDVDCWGIAMDQNGNLYVSDYEKHEVRQWKRGDKNGTIVAGGNGKGHDLNQLDHPTHLFVDGDASVYVSDRNNHRVMKWMKDVKEGIVVAGGNGKGHRLKQLRYPYGIKVDELSRIYVADFRNNRVVRWCEGAVEGSIVVGGNGQGEQPNQLDGPLDLIFDEQGSLYVSDCDNHRIQKFEIELQ